jgi:hypothetical protein
MKKLTTKFVNDHIDDQFMIGINALYWMGAPHSSMINILEENEYPVFSEQFYRRYGNFSPLNPDLAIKDIKDENYSIDFLDVSINWENFVIDVISFFHHSKCANDMKKLIKEKFLDHYEYIAAVNDTQQENEAKKMLDEWNDARMLTFFEFRDYLWSLESDNEYDPMSIF